MRPNAEHVLDYFHAAVRITVRHRQVDGAVEEIGDRVVDGQKALNLAGRLEALRLPISSSARLMRVSRLDCSALCAGDARGRA